MIEEQQSTRKIGDLCNFDSGNGFRPQDWKRSGLPIIRIQNLNGSDAFNYFEGTPDPAWIVEPGELLFAWAGVKGVSFGPTIWNGPRGVLNQHIYRIRPKPSVHKQWLYYALSEITAEIESKAHGFKTSLVHVRKADITDACVAVPALNEQEAVAATLALWDAAIAKTARLIHKKESLHEALTATLYSLSHRTGVPTSFGEILTESVMPGTSGRYAKKLTVKLYGKGVVPKEDKREGSEQTKYFFRRAGQLIYSKLDFLNGAFGIVPQSLDGYESTLDLPAFDIDDAINSDWLLGYLTRPLYYGRQLALARGQRKARRVHPSDLLASTINVPPRDTQDRIAQAMQTSRDSLATAALLLDRLKVQRRGILRRLLTGKWRVPITEGVTA